MYLAQPFSTPTTGPTNKDPVKDGLTRPAKPTISLAPTQVDPSDVGPGHRSRAEFKLGPNAISVPADSRQGSGAGTAGGHNGGMGGSPSAPVRVQNIAFKLFRVPSLLAILGFFFGVVWLRF